MKSAIEIYVAMSRCRESQYCLLTARFDKALFQSGPLRPENTVLLARLRGDDDAFRELLEKYIAEAEARKQAAATQQRAAAGRNREVQAARAAKNSPDSQTRKGRTGGLANTRKQQRTKGRTGGLGNDKSTQRAKAKKRRAPKRKCADPEVQAGAPLQPCGGLHSVHWWVGAWDGGCVGGMCVGWWVCAWDGGCVGWWVPGCVGW